MRIGIFRFEIIIPVVSVLISFFLIQTPVVDTIEQRIYDLMFQIKPNPPISNKLTLVVIDDASEQEIQEHLNKELRRDIGRWPWPRDIFADVVDAIRDLNARLIAFDILFENKQEQIFIQDNYLGVFNNLKSIILENTAQNNVNPNMESIWLTTKMLLQLIEENTSQAFINGSFPDFDQYLKESFQKARNIILGVKIVPVTSSMQFVHKDALWGELIERSSENDSTNNTLIPPNVYYNSSYQSLGHINILPINGNSDRWDSVIRKVALLLPMKAMDGSHEKAYWSLHLSLAIFMAYYGVKPDQIHINAGESMVIKGLPSSQTYPKGELTIPLTQTNESYVNWIRSPLESYDIQIIPFSTLYEYHHLHQKYLEYLDILSYTPDEHKSEIDQSYQEDVAKFHERKASLEPLIKDRILIVGQTLTAGGDIGATPVSELSPKMLTHANLVNSFLTNSFFYVAPYWVYLIFILLFNLGLGISLLPIRKPLPTAFLGILFLSTYTILTIALTIIFNYYTGFVGGIVSLFLTFISLTIYKYVITQRSNELLREANYTIAQQHEELKLKQQELIQAQKMAALGQLLSGISHELNNPLNFIQGAIFPLKQNVHDIIDLKNEVKKLWETPDISNEDLRNFLKELQAFAEEIDIDLISEEMNTIINNIETGVNRSAALISKLKTTARKDSGEKIKANLHKVIDDTLMILDSQFENRIEIIKDYKGEPEILCSPNGLAQVFTNILSNAAQAIEKQGSITIKTWNTQQTFFMSFTDTGNGIPKSVVDKIFEPFFTTKDVGKGSGLGLSITFDIVSEHHGVIKVDSEEGKGTTFTIELPL